MSVPQNTTPIVIIADDLTGAAEIAAIAAEFGISARVSRAGPGSAWTSLDLPGGHAMALDTDTRSASLTDAAAVISSLPPLAEAALVYKKTDSLLRGNPGPELQALMRVLAKPRALLLAQNPSKGRVIRGGHYFVDQTPLHQTSFNADPEHPRLSSRIAELLSPAAVTLIEPGQAPAPEGISVGNAATLEEIAWFARELPANALAAGGADFFRALLCRGLAPADPMESDVESPRPPRLIISGSASHHARQTIARWRQEAHPVHPLESEAAAIIRSLRVHDLAIVAITDPIDPARATLLRHRLAIRVREILMHPEMALQRCHLYIEGGATAAACVEALAWRDFDVVRTLAPGVITLRPVQATHLLLTIKPGSYPWPPAPITTW